MIGLRGGRELFGSIAENSCFRRGWANVGDGACRELVGLSENS